ncbi:uncharacterized protein PV07_10861 [Cladophialophora immunda]|uniref:Uncharacterized protein n=1 Tax=Cladophialophora immunda TaxID=569365 RepID=A0A0D2ACN0_9EURO|nr:uncharacterized protein PV07_10861 [Cladophialophora immunda]KIW22577.1 hypothetical protein PV07_10861 [Cladophialophora immunda]OQV02329.1 hypothetical protein CLAIMM_07547 [Cladophialophora immunda]
MAQMLTYLLSFLLLSETARAGHGRGKLFPQETTKVVHAASSFSEYNSERVTIKYAPVSVPPMSENDGMAQFFQPSTTLPCRDCVITWLQMGLEHADGIVADANTGMWLHHGVMVNRNRTDAVCGDGSYGQRFAASGNERTALDFSAGGTVKAGYYVGPADEVALAVDLMNMLHSEPQPDIVFTITYEYIKGCHAQEFISLTPYWMDVGGCRSSDVPAYRDSVFNYSSPTLKVSAQGVIAFVGGHLHDGGTHIDFINNGRVACSVNALYDQYQYLDDGKVTEHVSGIESCKLWEDIAPEDEWSIVAYYDTNLHEPMRMMDGSLEPVMGIMLVYVAPGLGRSEMTRTKFLNIVLGLVSLTAMVFLVVAWYRLQGRCGSGKKIFVSTDTLSTKDRDLEQEAVVPLIKT